MPGNANVVPGLFPYFGFLVKDAGARLAMMGHKLKSHRHMYPVMRHQHIRAYRGMLPWTQEAGFIAPSAYLCGNVVLGHHTSVFYHSVVRNYHTRNPTVVGDHSVLMDRTTLIGQVRVGHHVYVGTGATLDCCDVGDHAYIGPGASVALGVVVENNAIVAAGSAVPKDAHVNAGELWAGNPAQKIADVTPEQSAEVLAMVEDQVHIGEDHARAIHDHITQTAELDANWLKEMVKEIERQQQQVTVRVPVDIPLEARRFLEPRVYMRRPEMHMRMSYPVNRIAPWMPKVADQTANA